MTDDIFYKVDFKVDVKGISKFIYVLVPVWFESVIRKLEKDEGLIHRWFYFLYPF